MHHQTFGLVDRVAGGINRTTEGLHATGQQNFEKVGDKNNTCATLKIEERSRKGSERNEQSYPGRGRPVSCPISNDGPPYGGTSPARDIGS